MKSSVRVGFLQQVIYLLAYTTSDFAQKNMVFQWESCSVPSGGKTMQHQHSWYGWRVFLPSLRYFLNINISVIINADTDRLESSYQLIVLACW